MKQKSISKMNWSKVPGLLRDRRLWSIIALIGLVAIITYLVEDYILIRMPAELEKAEMRLLLGIVRGGLSLMAVMIAAWSYQFKGGLVATTVIGLMLLPSVAVAMTAVFRAGVLAFYVTSAIMLIAISWLVGSSKQAEKELERLYQALKVASLDTIYRLSQAAEYKDRYTGAHIQRMSRYAVTIARKLGLKEDLAEAILYAAPMHDVGKIGISDYILLKPAKLDPPESEVIKQHPIMGAQILEGSDAETIKLAEVIALTHHEKWDGSGYPKGLKGSEIPLAGRITAIADVFDALTSRRPYRDALPPESAFLIIKSGRGSHFDPAVVDAFLAAKDEMLSIMDRYRD